MSATTPPAMPVLHVEIPPLLPPFVKVGERIFIAGRPAIVRKIAGAWVALEGVYQAGSQMQDGWYYLPNHSPISPH